MKHKLTLLASFLLVLTFSACKDDQDPKAEDPATKEIIQINTSFGEMIVYLYPGTPLHRENFIKLAGDGFYDSTEFHRNITNFVIQGGDPLSKDENRTNDGTGGPGYTIPAEIDSSQFRHKYGAIGAARQGDQVNPERKSNGSQFYICVNPNGSPHLNGNYTVFGEVILGMDVAETIVAQPTNSKDQPIDRIPMTMKVMKLTAKEIKDRYQFDIPE